MRIPPVPGDWDPDASGLDQVIARAAIDPAFRRNLLADPRRAIAESFGLQLPAAFRISFIERDPDVDVLLVLPDLVANVGELDDVIGVTEAENATPLPPPTPAR